MKGGLQCLLLARLWNVRPDMAELDTISPGRYCSVGAAKRDSSYFVEETLNEHPR